MEVHHHPHVEKKSFKEYLLEGLMIFVAVTMGFIAENIRESIENHETEKRNIEIVLNNQKNDTSRLVASIEKNKEKIRILDRVNSFNVPHPLPKDSVQELISLIYQCGPFYDFISNDAAIEQMKSSGSLRLIKKQNIADSILKYEYINKIIKLNESVLEFEYDKTLETAAKLNDLSAYAISTGTQFVPPHLASLSTPILGNLNGNDTVLTKEYFNYAAEQALSLKYYVVILQKQRDYAGSLIAFLQKQYNLQ